MLPGLVMLDVLKLAGSGPGRISSGKSSPGWSYDAPANGEAFTAWPVAETPQGPSTFTLAFSGASEWSVVLTTPEGTQAQSITVTP